MVGLLNQAQPQLTDARANLDEAIDARVPGWILTQLSPLVRDLLWTMWTGSLP